MLSEWIHVFPNEWGAEGPALIGAYGMGLQGWDASFLFQNGDDGRFSDRIGRDQWDATAPQIMGLFPAVARQVRRGDVNESPLRAPLNVHVPSLWEGRLSFGDATQQGYDDKAFSTDKVPARALGAARAAVRFTDRAEETPAFDLSRNADAGDGSLVADGGQLRWYEAKPDAKVPGGYVTVDTAGTKAVVGFAAGATRRLGGATGITITPRSPFAAVYVTAREPGAGIEKSTSLVVVAISRARNAGMTFSPEGDRLLSRGEKGPVLLEPVRADIALGEALARRAVAVHVLDHDGRRTGKTLPLTGGAFTLDGATDRTPYYEIELRK
jgi:hypothetical protein